MSFQSLSLPDLVTQARRLFVTARDNAEASALLVPRFYSDADEIAGHAGRVDALDALLRAEATEKSDAVRATDAVEAAQAAVAGRYGADRELARTVYPRGSDEYAALGLSGRIPGSRSDLFAQASDFWTKAAERPDLSDPVPGLSAASAQEALAMVASARQAQDAQGVETQQFEAKRDERQTAESDVRREATKLARIARIALKDRPDLLTAMGV